MSKAGLFFAGFKTEPIGTVGVVSVGGSVDGKVCVMTSSPGVVNCDLHSRNTT